MNLISKAHILCLCSVHDHTASFPGCDIHIYFKSMSLDEVPSAVLKELTINALFQV